MNTKTILLVVALSAVVMILLGGNASALLPNDAKYVSDNMPGKIDAGDTVQVTVIMKNTGQNIWLPVGKYGQYYLVVDGKKIPVPVSTGTGQTCKFKFNVATNVPGYYSLSLRMMYQSKTAPAIYFGETHTIKYSVPGNYSMYVSDTIPAQIAHDHSVAVTVKFKNMGTTTWTAAGGYGLLYRGTRVAQVSGSVSPGATATFMFNLNVHTPGSYSITLQMSKNNNVPFGPLKIKTLVVT
jgi:hypothetical protein